MPLIELIRSDVARTAGHAGASRVAQLRSCLREPGVHAAAVYRYGRWLRERGGVVRIAGEPAYQLAQLYVHAMWGIEISPAADIGPGLYIGHFGGIVIGKGVVIGRDCNLSHQVTIGAAGSGTAHGAPVIGDGVYFAPGAKAFGAIRIGDRVKVGANAVVYADVPDGAVVRVRTETVTRGSAEPSATARSGGAPDPSSLHSQTPRCTSTTSPTDGRPTATSTVAAIVDATMRPAGPAAATALVISSPPALLAAAGAAHLGT